jgi:hypothetical protein
MPNPTDPAAGSTDELRDALAAVAEALDVPRPDGMAVEQRLEWLEACHDRATAAAITIEWMLKPGAPIADHVRYLRGQVAARGER